MSNVTNLSLPCHPPSVGCPQLARPFAICAVASQQLAGRLEGADGALRVRLSYEITLPVPAARTARYQPHVGREGLTFGLRPEHLTEAKPIGDKQMGYIDAALEVTEPLGMETLVFFRINGKDVCARVSPDAGALEGVRMRLAASVDNMHLIEHASGRVI